MVQENPDCAIQIYPALVVTSEEEAQNAARKRLRDAGFQAARDFFEQDCEPTIVFFAKQREQTAELVTAIEELKEREDGWTPEALEKVCIKMLDKMEPRLRELTTEFLYEN